MKLLQKTIFLMLVLFVCPNVHACKSYKMPDLRQQRQQARHLELHFQKINAHPTSRFEKRHPHMADSGYDGPSIGQTATVAMLALMLFVPTVSAKNSLPQEVWPAAVHKVQDRDWAPESRVFGPCETLPDYSRLCCDIQKNCTVTCYETDRARYVSFGLSGVVDDQSEYSEFNVSAAFFEAKKMCDERPHTRQIASETFDLLRNMNPRYLQNLNGTSCTVERLIPAGDRYDMNLTRPDGFGQPCPIQITDISNTRILPSLTSMINNFARRFNLQHMPRIFIYSNGACPPSAQQTAAMVPFTVQHHSDGSLEKFSGIIVPYATLLKYSDDQLSDLFGHEVHHLKQFEFDGQERSLTRGTTGNNRELEADLASVLVNGNPCLAIWIEEFAWDESDTWQLLIPFTQDTTSVILNGIAEVGFMHPPHPIRMSAILHMDEFYKKARELLRLTAE